MGVFGDRAIPRVLTGGAILAVICYFIPDLMFSGEASIGPIMADPAQVGITMLLFMAALKPLMLALSFKSGYLGGPIFPVLFAAIMIGLALSLVFPGVPVNVLTACIEAAVVTLVLDAPLTSILLVAVITAADANLLELIVVAAVTAMIAGQAVKTVVGAAQRFVRRRRHSHSDAKVQSHRQRRIQARLDSVRAGVQFILIDRTNNGFSGCTDQQSCSGRSSRSSSS